MPEPETTETTTSDDTSASDDSEPGRAKKAAGAGASRQLSARADRSLKDVDRLLKKSPQTSPQDRAMAQIEQAKVLALLQLAEAVREGRKAKSPPT